MTHFYASSPKTALDSAAVERLMPADGSTPMVGKLKGLYNAETHTVRFFKLPMGPIERIWAYISLIFMAPLSLLFPQLRERTSEYSQGQWLVYSIAPITEPRFTGSSVSSVAARTASAASASMPSAEVPPAVTSGSGYLPHPPAAPASPPPVAAASGGGSGRVVGYEMSPPPRPVDVASQIIAGECSILDRSLHKSLAAQLETLPKERVDSLMTKVKEQIRQARTELIELMKKKDENDFIKNAPRMHELFAGLFACLYAPPFYYADKPNATVDAYYLCGKFASSFSHEFPFGDAADTATNGEYLNFAFDEFVSIARELRKLPLERQLLVDCEYPLHLLEGNYCPKGEEGSGRPLADSTGDNIAIVFRNYMEIASPYLAGRFNALHTAGLGIYIESSMYETLFKYFGEYKDNDAKTMLRIAKEVHDAATILHETGSEMIRVEEWPTSVQPLTRALFDLTDIANSVGSPGLEEIAHGSDWRLIRVPQEKELAVEPTVKALGSDCPITLTTILGASGHLEVAQLTILAETAAIGYALLAPLASGSPAGKEEVQSFLDNLEDLKGATSIADYGERLLSNDGEVVRLCRDNEYTPEKIAEIVKDRRKSFQAAQKSKDFLTEALAGGVPLEKLLASRRFIDHLYRYLWFLNNREKLPDLPPRERTDKPADDIQLTKVDSFIMKNPLSRTERTKVGKKYPLYQLTRVGNKEIVRTGSLDEISRLRSPSRIVIYHEEHRPVPLMAVAI